MKMIRSTAPATSGPKCKETPFNKLPRQQRDIKVEAGRQGFDDGYFQNSISWKSTDTFDIYMNAYRQGSEQRVATDRATRRKIKP
jgi:hypothetical protein